MKNSRMWRWGHALSIICILLVVTIVAYKNAATSCMGVKVLSEKEMQRYSAGDFELQENILAFQGEYAAVDIDSSTVYIPQNIQEDTVFNDLVGKLSITTGQYRLGFAPDTKWDTLNTAVHEGHGFRLLLIDENNSYIEYRVVFTALPVLKIDGQIISKDEEGRDLWQGDLSMLTPYDAEVQTYTVKTSEAQWHIRGGYTAGVALKKSWKIGLKDSNGENKNIAFLGMGSDDDWLLNALSMDDTKIKEALFLNMWNSLAETADYNYKGSTGSYVEVVINGDYQGLYFLQRRLDKKYLSLGDKDILFKGTDYSKTTVEEAYEIVSTHLDVNETYALMSGTFTGEDCSSIDINNFIDINLFFQFAAAYDNFSLKNIYHLLVSEGDTYRQVLIPWDTDMSFGITYNNGFKYMYDYCVNTVYFRRELEGMKKIEPNLDQLMAKRWFDLRQSCFAYDNIMNVVDDYKAQIDSGSAYARNLALWGTRYGDLDTVEALRIFVRDRLQVLDTYYSAFL